jgi:HEAT repeat protein
LDELCGGTKIANIHILRYNINRNMQNQPKFDIKEIKGTNLHNVILSNEKSIEIDPKIDTYFLREDKNTLTLRDYVLPQTFFELPEFNHEINLSSTVTLVDKNGKPLEQNSNNSDTTKEHVVIHDKDIILPKAKQVIIPELQSKVLSDIVSSIENNHSDKDRSIHHKEKKNISEFESTLLHFMDIIKNTDAKDPGTAEKNLKMLETFLHQSICSFSFEKPLQKLVISEATQKLYVEFVDTLISSGYANYAQLLNAIDFSHRYKYAALEVLAKQRSMGDNTWSLANSPLASIYFYELQTTVPKERLFTFPLFKEQEAMALELLEKLKAPPEQLLESYSELLKLAKKLINIPSHMLEPYFEDTKVGVEVEFNLQSAAPITGFSQNRFEVGIDGECNEMRTGENALEYTPKYMLDLLNVYTDFEVQPVSRSGSFHFHLDQEKFPEALDFAKVFPFGQDSTTYRIQNEFNTIEFRSITPVYLDNKTINTRHMTSMMHGVMIASKDAGMSGKNNKRIELSQDVFDLEQIIFTAISRLNENPLARLNFLLAATNPHCFESVNISTLLSSFTVESYEVIFRALALHYQTNTTDRKENGKTKTIRQISKENKVLLDAFFSNQGDVSVSSPDFESILKNILKLLDSKDPQVRYTSLKFLSSLPEAQKTPLIQRFISMLSDREWQARYTSLQFLLSLPETEKIPLIPHVISMLRDEDWRIRSSSLQFLLSLPEAQKIPLIPHVISMLSDRDGDVRNSSLQFLLSLPETEKIPLIPHVISMLSDRDWRIRNSSLKFLLSLPEAQKIPLIPHVISMLGDEESDVRNSSLQCLLSLPEAQKIPLIPRFISMLGDGDYNVRNSSLKFLFSLPEAQKTPLIPTFKSMLSDRDGDVRNSSLQCLLSLPETEKIPLIPTFKSMLSDRDWRVRNSSLKFLLSLPEAEKIPLIPHVISMLRDEDWRIRNSSLQCLLSLPEAEKIPLIPTFKSMLRDEDWRVRNSSLQCLLSLPEAQQIPLVPNILPMIQDSKEDIRCSAMSYFISIIKVLPENIKKSILKNSDKNLRYTKDLINLFSV